MSDDAGDGQRWLRADGRELTALDLKIYRRAGLSPQQALEWADAGLMPYATESFREAGHDLATARKAHDLGLTSRDASLARDLGCTLEELVTHRARDTGVDEIRRAGEVGIDSESLTRHLDAGASLAQVEQVLAEGVPKAEVDRWIEAGLSLEACLAELRRGTPRHEVPQWCGYFPIDAERRCWSAVVESGQDAKRLKDDGYRPIDILDGVVDSTALPDARRDRPTIIVDDLPPILERPDGAPVPSIVTELFVQEEGDLDILWGLGFEVRVGSRRDRLLGGTGAGIAFEVVGRLGARRFLRALPRHEGGVALEELEPSGATRLLGLYDDLNSAVIASVGLCQHDEAVLSEARSEDLPPEYLLRLVWPWAAASSAPSVRINHLWARPMQNPRTGPLYYPSEPMEWTGHRHHHGTVAESVDGFFFRRVGFDGELRFVGWFEDPSSGLEASAEEPVAEVRRSSASGGVSSVLLERNSRELVLEGGRPARRCLGHLDVLQAFRTEDLLRRVRPAEVTEIRLSPEAPWTAWDIASRLLVEDPTHLDDDHDLDWPEDLADLGEEYEEYRESEGVGSRRLFINGDRWLLVAVTGRRRPIVLLADPEFLDGGWLVPDAKEWWASFSAIEWGSMCSGTDRWTLGSASDDLVLEVNNFSDEPPSARLRRGKRDRRLWEIARWLVRLREEMSLDVPMLAVEHLVGDSDVTYGSEFNDDGSDSMECHISLNVAAHETEDFLRILSRVGGRSAVDAIRHPRSAVGQRRQGRLHPSE